MNRWFVVLALTLTACGSSNPPPTTQIHGFVGGVTQSKCQYRAQGSDPLMVLPDKACTPGATNPQVTQATIKTTICKTGWTTTVRPTSSVTNKIKKQSLQDYGLPASVTSTTELDHLLPLEVGGAPSDPKNLWVEPDYTTPQHSPYVHNPKDAVELAVRNAVCSGKVTLAAAQKAMMTNWINARTILKIESKHA